MKYYARLEEKKKLKKKKLIREVNDKISKYRNSLIWHMKYSIRNLLIKRLNLCHIENFDRIEIQANANRRLEEYRNKASNNKQG